MMRNGHDNEPAPQSVWEHLALHGNEPPSPDVLEFAANCEKVRALIRTGAFDEYSDDEKYRLFAPSGGSQ
jgi:hypothetical protein